MLAQVKLKWLRVTKAGFQDKSVEPGGRIQNQRNPVGSKERNLPKSTPKTYPLSIVKFQRIGYSIYSPQDYNPHKIFYLTLMVP